MHIHHGLPAQPPDQPTLLTIGNFDGVHLGHQALIREMVAKARSTGRKAGVLTFDRHPLSVLAPDRRLAFLSTLDERLDLLAGLGLDFAIIHPFTQATVRTPARQFVVSVRERVRLSELWVGPDFKLGYGQEGNVTVLQALGAEIGFAVKVAPAFCVGGQPVHSTLIRTLLDQGDVGGAARLLGRPYQAPARIVAGTACGRALGYPAVRLRVDADRVMPCCGVYAGWAASEDRQVAALITIRSRRRGAAGQRLLSVEACPLNAEEHLPGPVVMLRFGQQLHGDGDAPTMETLEERLAADIAAARQTLALCANPD